MDFVFASTWGSSGSIEQTRRWTVTSPTTSAEDSWQLPRPELPQPQPRGCGRPAAPSGTACPSDHDRARGPRSHEQAVEPAQTGKPAACRHHGAARRHADARCERDNKSSRVGELRGAARQPWGRHISNGILRLRAREGRSTADRVRHDDRLAQRRAQQTLRRPNIVDEPIDDLSAPASVRSAPPPRARLAEARRTGSRSGSPTMSGI